MARPIKFRGRRVDNGRWIYGDLIMHSTISPFTCIAKGTGYKVDDPEIGKPIAVLPSTVGELTGLLDKNGKEIYEGDIVTLNVAANTEILDKRSVAWVDGSFVFRDVHDEQSDWRFGVYKYFPTEVIGNIYESPELLK